jgi:hypothetical protein
MDGKNKIVLVGGDQQEHIDVSITFDAACSLYVVINKGLAMVISDRVQAMDLYDQMEKAGQFVSTKAIREQILIMEVCIKHTSQFKDELAKVIKELDEKPKSKIILPRPKF